MLRELNKSVSSNPTDQINHLTLNNYYPLKVTSSLVPLLCLNAKLRSVSLFRDFLLSALKKSGRIGQTQRAVL